eukprot:361787-Chlamydomonas_euryale.AAC.2
MRMHACSPWGGGEAYLQPPHARAGVGPGSLKREVARSACMLVRGGGARNGSQAVLKIGSAPPVPHPYIGGLQQRKHPLPHPYIGGLQQQGLHEAEKEGMAGA